MSSTNYKFTRHDFIDGEILEADHLNNLEEAIEQLFYGLEILISVIVYKPKLLQLLKRT